MANKSVAVFVKYLCVSALIFVSSFGSVLGVAPFGAGVFMGLCLSGLNAFILAPVYVLSTLGFSFELNTLLGASVVAAVFCAIKILEKFKKIPPLAYYGVAIVSLAGFIPKMLSSPAALILFVFFAPITMFVSSTFFNAVFKRGLRFKMLDYEYICASILLVILSLGLNRLDIVYFPTVVVFASFAILVAGRVYGFSGCMIAGLCFGIGGAVFDYQLIWFAYYPVMALLCGVFLPAPRVFSAFSNLIGYTLITYFFDIPMPHAYLWLIAILIGGTAYVVIPQSKLKELKNILNPAFSPASARFNVNLLKEESSGVIFKTGEVFSQMANYISGNGDIQIPAHMSEKLREGVCIKCPKRADCPVKQEELEEVLRISIEKGRATVVDLPPVMINECRLAPAMITLAASLSEHIAKKREKAESVNLAKTIIGEQLSGMGEVLKQMSGRLKTPVGYDFESEAKIKEEMIYRGICCLDIVISPSAITLVVARQHYSKDAIEKILKKITKTFYKVEREEESHTGLVVYCTPAPLYDVVFAVASLAKGEYSGDTHSFIKIGNKFLMALCDGMGSGKDALNYAFNTVSLIECFYKAGYEHNMVIKSVNRFLSLSNEESFAACDICVVDLNDGAADIFKIGSPACYIKGAQSVKAIEGSCLPMGAFEDIRPSFSQNTVNEGDMIILVSDGIADCFENDSLAGLIANSSDVSPDALCKQILAAAKIKSPTLRDDMTVAALRIFMNV